MSAFHNLAKILYLCDGLHSQKVPLYASLHFEAAFIAGDPSLTRSFRMAPRLSLVDYEGTFYPLFLSPRISKAPIVNPGLLPIINELFVICFVESLPAERIL